MTSEPVSGKSCKGWNYHVVQKVIDLLYIQVRNFAHGAIFERKFREECEQAIATYATAQREEGVQHLRDELVLVRSAAAHIDSENERLKIQLVIAQQHENDMADMLTKTLDRLAEVVTDRNRSIDYAMYLDRYIDDLMGERDRLTIDLRHQCEANNRNWQHREMLNKEIDALKKELKR
jgi:predicted Zn-dependent peptidase